MRIDLPRWEQAKVLVVGDLMLDRYWHGGTSRISPEAPVPVVHVQQSEERVGGAGNVAVNVAALGAQAAVLGLLGHDDAGRLLGEALRTARVENYSVVHDDLPTITKLRVMSRHQQLIRLDFEEGPERVPVAPLVSRLKEKVQEAGIVVMSDYGKGVLREPRELIDAARAAGKRVLVDPKTKDFGLYRGASIITPNFSEFEAVVGRCRSEQEIVDRGRRLAADLGLEALLVTRGEYGMSLVRPVGEPVHLPTQAREVYDVTGAGDTVIAVLAASLAANAELPTAMYLANVAAGIVVGKMGTATASVAEIRHALHVMHEFRAGILDEDELVALVRDSRARGETVVMTNGCFDILHAGHVQYLEEARKLGHRLIVAVNDDDSVRRLKGAARPINNLTNRMAVLAALECVDWVVGFSEDTPERLICRVLPDVLVKGGDYRPEEVAGGDCVTRNGGRVQILGFKEGLSTSAVITAIRGLPAGREDVS